MCNRGGPRGARLGGPAHPRCRIKLCGLSREVDIAWANELMPDYVGFVFAKGSRRYVEPVQAKELRRQLRPGIVPVGVFVDAPLEEVAGLLGQGVIEAAQLHGREDAAYIRRLRGLLPAGPGPHPAAEGTSGSSRGPQGERPEGIIWQAFPVRGREDIARANASEADLVLLDSGRGSGERFDWSLPGELGRPWFLAGGLTPENVGEAIEKFHPFGVDASSSLETGGYKDRERMAAFVRAAREREE